MTLTITSWNVNSLRIRLEILAAIDDAMRPDILCLQETKVTDPQFPHEALANLGYVHRHIQGMKSYNGVAIVSRKPLRNAGTRCWLGRGDCRHVFADVEGPDGEAISIHNIYVPAGGDDPDPTRNPKFAHKLAFLDAMAAWSEQICVTGARAILAGDFNVAPLETDVWDHRRLRNVITHTAVEIDKLDRIRAAGQWTDGVRHLIPASERLFTWWSYRASDWSTADKGRRLDHIWVTAPLADSLRAAHVLRAARGWQRPSDHAPVTVTLDL